MLDIAPKKCGYINNICANLIFLFKRAHDVEILDKTF